MTRLSVTRDTPTTVRGHLGAAADHVCVQVLPPSDPIPALDQLASELELTR